MVQRKISILCRIFVLIYGVFAAHGLTTSNILPSKVAIYVDTTSNVHEAFKQQMFSVAQQIIAELPGESFLDYEGISDRIETFYKGLVKDKPRRIKKDVPAHNRDSIDAKVLSTLIYESFPFSKFIRTAEILIILVEGDTRLTGTLPDIVWLKKTIVVQFGPKEQEVWRNMSSRADMAFCIQSPDMIQTDVQKITEQLMKASKYVCDTNKFTTFSGASSREKLYFRCQCAGCENVCNFESADNVSLSCRNDCSYHPKFKTTHSDHPRPINTPSESDDFVSYGLPAICVVFFIGISCLIIYYIRRQRLSKGRHQMIRNVVAHQVSQEDAVSIQVHDDQNARNVDNARDDPIDNDGEADRNEDARSDDGGTDDQNEDARSDAGVLNEDIRRDDDNIDDEGSNEPLIDTPRDLQRNLDAFGEFTSVH